MKIPVLVQHEIDETDVLHVESGVGPQCNITFLYHGRLVSGWVPMYGEHLRALLTDGARMAEDSKAATESWS